MFINYTGKSCSEPVKCIVSLFKTPIILETEGVFSWAVLRLQTIYVNHDRLYCEPYTGKLMERFQYLALDLRASLNSNQIYVISSKLDTQCM